MASDAERTLAIWWGAIVEMDHGRTEQTPDRPGGVGIHRWERPRAAAFGFGLYKSAARSACTVDQRLMGRRARRTGVASQAWTATSAAAIPNPRGRDRAAVDGDRARERGNPSFTWMPPSVADVDSKCCYTVPGWPCLHPNPLETLRQSARPGSPAHPGPVMAVAGTVAVLVPTQQGVAAVEVDREKPIAAPCWMQEKARPRARGQLQENRERLGPRNPLQRDRVNKPRRAV